MGSYWAPCGLLSFPGIQFDSMFSVGLLFAQVSFMAVFFVLGSRCGFLADSRAFWSILVSKRMTFEGRGSRS